ncbi:flavin-containing monooxygenase [Phyllobacterium zundukense]|uniref:Cyclohexanone monooxygenase n=1 Tax=Phyllobacterium zundukense TaxID=1867719 RepID=A0A2N9VUR4_9HYPH|nr:NAD(P)/FAD-dependent oxidoreductase [Phyllobacterium zundukense]ATU95314.1 cyclohexanone monooxygenase [Phyllobacterium zundukense]PIO43232.1 cyclohexanone monooxygenase [Phyllobacterium zundukense]
MTDAGIHADRERTVPESIDVIIVGAGFAGMYMLHRVRSLGLSVLVLEAGGGVGGTWYWNRYPGARCDVESMQYSYSFSDDLQQEWKWRERFAPQSEILAYANHVAQKFDLVRDIRFETRVVAAEFHEADSRWQIVTDKGGRFSSKFLVMATGCLSVPLAPKINGLENYRGNVYHTGNWPQKGVDFTGQTVGLVGTGSSGIQATPEIAKQAKHLFVFQRSPNFSIPARNCPISPEYEAEWKRDYSDRRKAARLAVSGILAQRGQSSALEVDEETRSKEYERRWNAGGTNFMAAYPDLLLNPDANETAAAFVRTKIKEIVKDAAVAARLTPTDHPIGSKRICADTQYYDTFNRENVTLVDLRTDPIECAIEEGLRTAGGHSFAVDSLVLATGFDAMTGAIDKVQIFGRNGRRLRDKWQDGPKTYLGLMTAGFPNLFIVTGPGSPSVLTNMIVAIEDHVDWISKCISHMVSVKANSIEPKELAENEWVATVAAEAAKTLMVKAKSWYLGDNKPGKPHVFLAYVGGLPKYQELCDQVAAEGYRGFEIA